MTLIARRTKDGNAQARLLLERSLELDPGFAPAHPGIAWSQAEDFFFALRSTIRRTCLAGPAGQWH